LERHASFSLDQAVDAEKELLASVQEEDAVPDQEAPQSILSAVLKLAFTGVVAYGNQEELVPALKYVGKQTVVIGKSMGETALHTSKVVRTSVGGTAVTAGKFVGDHTAAVGKSVGGAVSKVAGDTASTASKFVGTRAAGVSTYVTAKAESTKAFVSAKAASTKMLVIGETPEKKVAEVRVAENQKTYKYVGDQKGGGSQQNPGAEAASSSYLCGLESAAVLLSSVAIVSAATGYGLMTALSLSSVAQQFSDVSKRLRLSLGSALGLEPSSPRVLKTGTNVAITPATTATSSAAVAKGRREVHTGRGGAKDVSKEDSLVTASQEQRTTSATSAVPNTELLSNDQVHAKRLRVVVNTEKPSTPNKTSEEVSTLSAAAVWEGVKNANEQAEANIKMSQDKASVIEKMSLEKASAFEKASAEKVAARLKEAEEEIERKMAAANAHVKNKVRAAEKAHALLLSKAAKEAVAIREGKRGVNTNVGADAKVGDDGEFNRKVAAAAKERNGEREPHTSTGKQLLTPQAGEKTMNNEKTRTMGAHEIAKAREEALPKEERQDAMG